MAVRQSIRQKVTRRELKAAFRDAKRGWMGPTAGIRRGLLMKRLKLARLIRQKQQAEKGLVEWPYTALVGGTVRKAMMSEEEAARRNLTLRSIGVVWQRGCY